MTHSPKDILSHYWGFSTFRTFQEEIIESVLQKNDTVALLPTGGGKSICYQIPALCMEGVCVVVSPLLALMKDQIENLAKRNIKALSITSEQSYWEQEDVFAQLSSENIALLYVSPERMSATSFIEKMQYIPISFIAVDEAHCISEWGNDFRPAYQKIKTFREAIGSVSIVALTATATEKVMIDIMQRLDLKQTKVFKNSFKRSNISIQILETEDKILEIDIILKSIPGSKIIYTRTRKEAETISSILLKKNHDVAYFHAGLPLASKRKRQQTWMQSSSQTLIATNAFGMGIDKEDVSCIIHYSPSYSLENYYQEIGRAGRNGNHAFAFQCYNAKDIAEMKSLVLDSIPTKEEYKKTVELLYSTLQIADGDFTEVPLEFHAESFYKRVGISRRKIEAILNYLHNLGCIYWNQKQELSSLQIHIAPEQLDGLRDKYHFVLEGFARQLNGVFTQEIPFSKAQFAQRFQFKTSEFTTILEEFHQKEYITFRDGNKDTMQFLWNRNDGYVASFWNEFEVFLKNKYLKYQELTYFITDEQHCKMRLIVGYFGEKTKENCGMCTYCMHKKQREMPLSARIYEVVQEPTYLDTILRTFSYEEKADVLQAIQSLLIEEKLKPLEYNLYKRCKTN